MRNDYTIERMTKDEMKIAIAWAAKEGWNPGLHDADCFYQADPQGFFAGKVDGKIIAIGSAVAYDENFAFCGFYRVDEAYRGQGYGLALTKARLAYVGQRNAGIDGVVTMLDKYSRLGYKIAHYNARYSGAKLNPPLRASKTIIPLAGINFDLIADYDSKHFPAQRLQFLNCWIEQPDAASFAYVKEGQIYGYGLIRACQQGFKIGPLFADNPAIADELFCHLVYHAKEKSVYLDIPENNPNALALVKRYQLEKVFETARMYLKNQPLLPIEQIYGITSFELG